MISQSKFLELEKLPFTDVSTNVSLKKFEPIVFKLEKDLSKVVTIIPVTSPADLPKQLVEVLREEFNYVVEEGGLTRTTTSWRTTIS